MADVINLNKARKARERAAAKATAEQNRVRHGRTGADKRKTEAEQRLAERKLDGHERD